MQQILPAIAICNGKSMVSDYFPWDPAQYSLKIQSMDDEHRTLIAKMNELRAQHDSGKPFSAVDRALTDLVVYTKQHFADEEGYMERIGYPRLRIHKGIHEQLLARLSELQRDCRAHQKLTEELFLFLRMWLKAHICGIDAQYAEYARKSNVA